MTCKVTYTNGDAAQNYDSIQAATTALLAQYPDGVIYDAGGFPHDADDEDAAYDVRTGRAGLAWECEERSVNDDGAHAVAEIIATNTIWCHGCGDEIEFDAANFHNGEGYCDGCETDPAEDEERR